MVRYLNGNEMADRFLTTIRRSYSSYEAELAVRGYGPFRRQIERMAEDTCIRITDLGATVIDPHDDLDTVEPGNVCDFFTLAGGSTWAPCVIDAIHTLIAMSCNTSEPITVLGRGRFGAFAATHLTREYGRVIWQSATKPIETPGIIVNCSRQAPESYPDDSTVIDINKIGRLTTAILLLRTIMRGHGAIDLV